MEVRRRTAASSSTVAHGCSTYSSPPAARSSTFSDARAVSTSQAPLASTRIRPPGPSASRTASSLAWSSARVPVASATFTLAVRQPDRATRACASSAESTGTVTLTGTRSRTGSGQSPAAASSAQRSQAAASSASYSRNGLHSPQPASPRMSVPSRTVIPRKRTRMAIEKTRTSVTGLTPQGASVDLAVAEHRHLVEDPQLARRPRPGVQLRHPVPGLVERQVADHPGAHPLAPLVVVEPADDLEPAVLVEPSGVGGQEPPVDQHVRGQGGVTFVAVEQRGPADPDPPVGADRHGHAV